MFGELVGFADYDLIGDEFIVGEDDLTDEELIELLEGDDDEEDEVGARRGRRGRRGRGGGRARRARRAGRGVVATRPQAGREILLGGQNTQGAAAGSLIISTIVQEMVRVDRLFINAVTDAGVSFPNVLFNISDIKVGTKSQLAGLPAVPAIMFTTDATGQGRRMLPDTVPPGVSFSVICQSIPALHVVTWGALCTALR